MSTPGHDHTTRPYPQTSIGDVFDQVIDRDAWAIACGDRQLRYGELVVAADALAARLQQLGAGPEVRVVLCLERSIELVIAMLAVTRAGGVYVALDVSLPAERLHFIIEDCGARVIVTQSTVCSRLPDAGVPVLVLDESTGHDPVLPVYRPDVHPDYLATIFYTSGTTGVPKGVGITHRGITRLVCNSVEVDFTAADVVAQIASPGFDSATLEIWGALLCGARLEVVPREIVLSPRAFVRLVRERGITVLVITTALFNEVAAQDPAAFSGLRCVMVGGETADPHAMDAVLAHGAPAKLFNGYGPTEVTTLATTYRLCAPSGGAAVPIGRPISNTSAFVLDDAMGVVDDGVEGELYLGGPGVARGYLGRPDLTAAAFVPSPLGGPGERLYRTGDRAVRAPSGELQFAGRRDRQLKIRGFRIELDEIEAVLRGHADVRDAVVIALRDPRGIRLVAYYVPRQLGAVAVTDLRNHVRDRLPDYMVPSAWCELEQLPVGAHGKIDRAQLAALPIANAPVGDPPRTALERTLAGLFCELLGIEQVGRDDSFFDLGGHSLLATRACARLRDELQLELSPTLVFAAPTVAALAARIEALLDAPRAVLLPPLQPATCSGPWPLSFAQERIWVLEQLVPGNVAYNCSFVLSLDGRLDVAALEQALSEIVRRHEILRTTFPASEGVPTQVVHPPFAIELPIVELDGATAEQFSTWLRTRTSQPFTLDALPLVRWELVRLGADRHALVQIEHHFVHDGWSIGVLLGEITALYAAFASHQPSPLDPLPVQFRDFATWERAAVATVGRDQLAYWQRTLTPAPPPLELGADFARPSHQQLVGAALVRDLPPGLYERADRMARAYGATPYMVFLAAFYLLLHRRSGQSDLTVGSVTANRRTRQSEQLIGMVLNTIALRVDVSGPLDVGELVRRVRDACLEAQAHADVPFHHVVAATTSSREVTSMPLFRTMFSFHDAAMPDLKFAGLEGRFDYIHNGSAKSDLNVMLAPHARQRVGSDDRVEMVWEYNTALFEAATALHMADEFLELADAIVANPDADVASVAPTVGVVTTNEIAWNDTSRPFPAVALGERFAEQARRTPAARAITCGEHTLTYAELDLASARLARELQARGVGPEATVALWAERSIELLVAMIAIARAGGAYVPIDPSLPAERVRFMIEDSRCRVVVSTRELAARLPAGVTTPVLACEDVQRASSRDAAPMPRADVHPDNLVALLYTSGTTGKPKAVGVTHRGICRLVLESPECDFAPTDVFSQLSSPSFDAATFEVWGALLHGASIVVFDRDAVLSPVRFAAEARERHVTIGMITTALFNEIARQAPDAFAGFRRVYFGGENADPRAVRTVLERGAPARLLHVYGPTEATTLATSLIVDAVAADARFVPIGLPITNTTGYVLDDDLRPVPVGTEGELCIGGPGVTRGYLGHPDLTAVAFVPDPFGEPGARLYRTGDRVKRLPTGLLVFAGRRDHQLKLRGFRVELQEIETTMLAFPGVAAAVAAVVCEGEARAIVGYFVPASGIDARALRAFLATRLPAYAVPSSLVALAAFPLTSGGKLDRASLPALAGSVREPARSSTELGRKIDAIWSSVLGTDGGAGSRTFFELGGSSLLVSRVLARLAGELGATVSFREFFEQPTIDGLATLVAARLEQARPVAIAPLATRRRP